MTAKFRTDLAAEMRERSGSGELPGVSAGEWSERGFDITRVDILDERGAAKLCKPIGSYITLSSRALAERLQIEGLDLDKNAVQRIESGERFVTDIELKVLSRVLGVSADELLNAKDTQNIS